MEEKNNYNTSRKYIQDFNPDIVRLTEQYQDYFQLFNAGSGNENFTEFLRNGEWEEYLQDKNGVTFIVFDNISENEKKVVAYYTVCAGAIPYTDRWLIPEEERDETGREYDEEECGISAVEIKMFAVSEEYQDLFFSYGGYEKPIAAWILHAIIDSIRELTITTLAAKTIFLQAVPEAEQFYINNGFDYVQTGMHAFHTVDSEFKAMYLPFVELKIHYDK